MKNTFKKVIVRLVIIAIVAIVWVLFNRGWQIGSLDTFADALLIKLKWVFAAVGLVAVCFARNKYV